jgi:hypothetical protein
VIFVRFRARGSLHLLRFVPVAVVVHRFVDRGVCGFPPSIFLVLDEFEELCAFGVFLCYCALELLLRFVVFHLSWYALTLFLFRVLSICLLFVVFGLVFGLQVFFRREMNLQVSCFFDQFNLRR